jgi:hypothetical protein
MNFRKYDEKLLISTKPIIAGEIPTFGSMSDRLFIAVANNDHVLSESEWSEVIGDNILCNGKSRAPKSPYKISELRIFNSPFSAEAQQIMEKAGIK